MLKNRVIPTLLIKNDGLVKTVKFKNPKYLGDPINVIKIFNEKEVDEIIVLDIEASRLNKEPNYNLIEQYASECFMPLCYGGGIKNIKQAKKLFSLGVEKISIQSEAYTNADFIRQLANQFGSQSIVVSMDIKKSWRGQYRLYSSKKMGTISFPWIEYLQTIVDAGAGEVVINSVDRDGTLSGMEMDLIKEACSKVNIPIIASGGVGCLDDIKTAVELGASAVAAGAFFVFKGPLRAVLITYPKYKDLEELFHSNE
jgi:imidazole glycerol-phosphate synthase subunit HisF